MPYPAAAGMQRVADRCRSRGVIVHEVPGWQDRGQGNLYPRGKVNHHTANPGPGDTSGLRNVTTGPANQRGARCNFYGSRSGGLYLVAAGLAYHAGKGSWNGVEGNSRVLGLEADNDGVGEKWDPRLVSMMQILDEECVTEFGYNVDMICEHREWAAYGVSDPVPKGVVRSRKIDRNGFHGPTWRGNIRLGLVTPIKPNPNDYKGIPHMQIFFRPTTGVGSDVGTQSIYVASTDTMTSRLVETPAFYDHYTATLTKHNEKWTDVGDVGTDWFSVFPLVRKVTPTA